MANPPRLHPPDQSSACAITQVALTFFLILPAAAGRVSQSLREKECAAIGTPYLVTAQAGIPVRFYSRSGSTRQEEIASDPQRPGESMRMEQHTKVSRLSGSSRH
jgi:hypothetical protein